MTIPTHQRFNVKRIGIFLSFYCDGISKIMLSRLKLGNIKGLPFTEYRNISKIRTVSHNMETYPKYILHCLELPRGDLLCNPGLIIDFITMNKLLLFLFNMIEFSNCRYLYLTLETSTAYILLKGIKFFTSTHK